MKDVYAVLILTAIVGGFALTFYQYGKNRAVANMAANEARITRELLDSLSSELVLRHEMDVAIREARNDTYNRILEAKNNDPDLSDYLDQRIPDGLREAHLDRKARD